MSKTPPNINSSFKKKSRPVFSKDICIKGIQKGDIKILSYVISKAESNLVEDQDFVRDIITAIPVKNNIRKIAISGSPGVGKSTFINSFGSFLVKHKKRIAVLPVDPSSHISHGSILGDKTRMEDLMSLDDAYIKPMASALALGGLAPSTNVAVMICERSNFDYIILETVGVGQSEYEARHMVDLFLLLLQPGGGDDLQGIKRGIMEMADLMIITKADGSLMDNANLSLKSYRNALKLNLPNNYNWSPEIIKYSSMTHKGQKETLALIDKYFLYMSKENRLNDLRHGQDKYSFEKAYKQLVLSRLLSNTEINNFISLLKQRIENKELIPLQALNDLSKKLEETL